MGRIFAVCKPKGPTSHDIVNEIRKITGERRIGHAGTLDPLASGVLVIGVGREATRKLGDSVKKEKEYIATIQLGMTSTTDDEEGDKSSTTVKQYPDEEDIKKILSGFIGKIEQTPPSFSAIKVNGIRSYKKARSGKDIVLKPRTVDIRQLELLFYEWPNLRIRTTTGPGTYIRALARDIGKALKVGGYLIGLERVRVGEFTLQNCISLQKIEVHTKP